MSRQLHLEFSNIDQQALQNQRQDKALQTLHIDGYLTFPHHSAKNDRLACYEKQGKVCTQMLGS